MSSSEDLNPLIPTVYRFAVYSLGDHHTAQDITQETMLRAWKHRKHLREVKCHRSWLLRVAANLCTDLIRSRRGVVKNAGPLLSDPESSAPEPWFAMLQQEFCRELDDTIRQLSERERTVLYLSAFEDLPNREIAEVLNLSLGATKVALSRARASVRQAILTKQKQETSP